MVKCTGNNRSLVVSELTKDQMPEEMTYQSRLRAAASGSVSESDVAEVVAGIVARAKTGDKTAIEQFFRDVLGSGNRPTKIVNNLVVADVETGARIAKRNGHRFADAEND